MKELDERETSKLVVRKLRPDDLQSVIDMDSRILGRTRTEYFKLKLQQNLAETGIKISLAAELDGAFVGFLLARVYYGEFGQMEPVAVLDTIGVHPDFQRQGVAGALMDQMRTDLRGLNVTKLRTEVGWDDPKLLMFFQHEGFRPAERFCLDLDMSLPADLKERRR